jgi:hypothetical protein
VNSWYARKLGWVLAHKLAFLIVLLLFVGTGAVITGHHGQAHRHRYRGKFRLGLEYDKSTALRNMRSRKVEPPARTT